MLQSIVIVGGGSAGWITAGILAAKYVDAPIKISLVESDRIGTIGVGEGTWPTMVSTLKKIGIDENEFIYQCDASYKQASHFKQWLTGESDDEYYHPFSMPQDFQKTNIAPYWLNNKMARSFANTVSIQPTLCEHFLAPKQASSPEYASVENHGYHLDAGKFANLLKNHCIDKLKVNHIVDDVVAIHSKACGDIDAIETQNSGLISGDLFIDCSGARSLLIGQHYQIPFISKKDILFIDKAIAVQVPYKNNNAPIASATISTAQTAGWIWDIGLSSRRGVGHVFSSAHISSEQAKAQLCEYLKNDVDNVNELSFRELDINPGHREKFWHRNCVAVGMSAGFLEPLEASALVMVELSATMIAEHLPVSHIAMPVVAANFNEVFLFRWQRIVDFLKLHYVLSQRNDSDFWRDNRQINSIPTTLQNLLTLWQEQPPSHNGFLSPYDLFPSASYQYILYGMRFKTKTSFIGNSAAEVDDAKSSIETVAQRNAKVVPLLPTNRALLSELAARMAKDASESQRCWFEVSVLEFPQLVDHYPLFFKKIANTDDYKCIALAGFNAGENLYDLNGSWSDIYQPRSAQDLHKSEVANEAIDDASRNFASLLAKHNLIEPVKLDITFNNNDTIMLEELYVINKAQLARPSARQQQEIVTIAANIQHMQYSLNNVARLIQIRNDSVS